MNPIQEHAFDKIEEYCDTDGAPITHEKIARFICDNGLYDQFIDHLNGATKSIRYHYIELYPGEKPHLDTVFNTADESCIHGHDYINDIIGPSTCGHCVWDDSEDEDGKLIQVFIRID
jgi:hypothetical protein